MSTPILGTKLYFPALQPNLVPRPRLIDQLQAGIETGRTLSLVAAPAGSGKTTMISAWAHSTPLPVAWVSLDEDDNEPGVF